MTKADIAELLEKMVRQEKESLEMMRNMVDNPQYMELILLGRIASRLDAIMAFMLMGLEKKE